MTNLLPLLLTEHQPTTALERHLTQQLAHILAKQATAEDNETHPLAKQPQYLLTHRPDGHLVPDPAYLLYNNRLDALRLHQARLGREQSRILRELHRLKRTPLVPKVASEPRSSTAAPKMSWMADIMADFDRKAAAAASEPGSTTFAASEPAPMRAANEPGSRALPASEPTGAPTRDANEPAYTWPVLSDAEADRIEAMIASGDIGQLEEAARLLGIMDPKAPVPPHILALTQSKLAG